MCICQLDLWLIRAVLCLGGYRLPSLQCWSCNHWFMLGKDLTGKWPVTVANVKHAVTSWYRISILIYSKLEYNPLCYSGPNAYMHKGLVIMWSVMCSPTICYPCGMCTLKLEGSFRHLCLFPQFLKVLYVNMVLVIRAQVLGWECHAPKWYSFLNIKPGVAWQLPVELPMCVVHCSTFGHYAMCRCKG
jgi:hypothetical protein